MKNKILIALITTIFFLFFTKEVYGSSFTTSESYLKIFTKTSIEVTEEYTYQLDDDYYIPLKTLYTYDVLPFENLGTSFLFKNKTITINNEDCISCEDIKDFYKMNYNYDYITNTLYYGEYIESEILMLNILEKTTYSTDDFNWLSKIIYAEARGENYQSKLAVGNVLLNRVQDLRYPDTIYGVIFDKKFGVQFSPVLDGTIYNDSNLVCKAVAIDTFLNINNCGESLFFMNPAIAETTWISENRSLIITYDNHYFYA
ncbi:MAG: cell wall hydrolase [Lachnospirales bacterium]